MDGWSGCTWDEMYSPFPDQRDDPLAWDQKMAFWMAAIQSLCLSRKTAIFHLSHLPFDFQKEGCTPKCLAMVVQHLVNLRLARRLSFYLSELDPDGSRWSIWDFMQKPNAFSFSWVRRLFGATGSQDSNSTDEEPYVMIELVQGFAEGVKEVLTKSLGSTPAAEDGIRYKALMQMSRQIVANESTFRLTLLHLSAQKRCYVSPGDDRRKIVRLVKGCDEDVQVSSREHGLARLKAMVEKLEESIDSIEESMARYEESAKECDDGGNKKEALRNLRRREELEPSLKSKERTLYRILGLVRGAEQAMAHRQELNTYRVGIEAYNTVKQNLPTRGNDNSLESKPMMTLEFNSQLTSTSDNHDLEKQPNEILDGPSSPPRLFSADPDGKTGAGEQVEVPPCPSVTSAAASFQFPTFLPNDQLRVQCSPEVAAPDQIAEDTVAKCEKMFE